MHEVKKQDIYKMQDCCSCKVYAGIRDLLHFNPLYALTLQLSVYITTQRLKSRFYALLDYSCHYSMWLSQHFQA